MFPAHSEGSESNNEEGRWQTVGKAACFEKTHIERNRYSVALIPNDYQELNLEFEYRKLKG